MYVRCLVREDGEARLGGFEGVVFDPAGGWAMGLGAYWGQTFFECDNVILPEPGFEGIDIAWTSTRYRGSSECGHEEEPG